MDLVSSGIKMIGLIAIQIFCTDLTFDLFFVSEAFPDFASIPFGHCHTSRITVSMYAGLLFYSIFKSKVKIGHFCLNGQPTKFHY